MPADPRLPFVTIIVPTRDNPAMLRQVVDGILRHSAPPFELVIVDNASSAAEARALLDEIARAPAVTVLRMATNRFYWPAINAGIRAADAACAYVVALNDDVVIQGPRWLPRLLEAFDDDATIGFVGDRGPADALPPLAGVVDGYCAAFRRDLFARVGLFDERRPFYWGFVDWQLRAYRLGYRGADVKASGDTTDRIAGVVHHLRGGTIKAVDASLDRRTRRTLFGSRWSPAILLLRNGFYAHAVRAALATWRQSSR